MIKEGQFLDVGIGCGHANYGEVSINIPNMVAELDKGMFDKYKEKLVKISIPTSVNCPNLREVLFCGNNEFENIFELFENCPNLESVVIVPHGANEYRSDRQGYKEIKREGHDISEIAEAISDRKIADINGAISEISVEKEIKLRDDENRE